MSASKSKTKEATAQTQTSSGTATTTPNTPDWLAQPWQQYAAGVSGLQNSGQPLIAGAQPLQQQAFDAATRLGANGPVSFGGGVTAGSPAKNDPNNPQVNGGPGDGYAPSATGMGTSPTSNFDLASALGLNAATSGANLATSQGYDPSLASASSASSRGFDAAELQKRLSPYLSEVRDTALADFDVGAGRQQAAARLQGSKNGGLYNSNNAIRDAIMSADLTRGRGTLSAGISDQGFGRASDILTSDNNREAQTNIANAQMATQVALANAAAQNGAFQFGAGAANTNSMFNAGQQDSDLARQLQAASLLGSIGSAQGNYQLGQSADTRANIGLQADLGGQQRDIANAQSPAATQALIAQLLGGIPMDAFVGQTENRNQTGSGTGSGTSSSSGYGFDLASLWGASNSGGR